MKPYWQYNNVKLYCEDCLDVMDTLEEGSIQLTITSPPYNCNKEYGEYADSKSMTDYFDWIGDIAERLLDITESTGRLCWNVGMSYINNNNKNIYNWIESMYIFTGYGWMPYTTIIWAKGRDEDSIEKNTLSTTAGCAWGSWLSASAPAFRGTHEYIHVFYKDARKRNRSGVSDITRDEFITNTMSVWPMMPSSNKIHPATFPLSLPYKLIRTFSYVDDVIFDPFCGSGTTMIAAIMTGRPFIGVEINEEYCEYAVKQVRDYLNQPSFDF